MVAVVPRLERFRRDTDGWDRGSAGAASGAAAYSAAARGRLLRCGSALAETARLLILA